MSGRYVLKRKLSFRKGKTELSRKRLKRKSERHESDEETETSSLPVASTSNGLTPLALADQLPWKTVVTPFVTEFEDDGEGGMMELEEVEGVEIVYEENETGRGRVAGFRVVENKDQDDSKNEEKATSAVYPPIVIEPFNNDTLTSWSKHPLHPSLLHSLHKRNFLEPTPIQKETLDVFFTGKNRAGEHDSEDQATDQSSSSQRDIIGIAQTGSGKTLAYGLPILHHLLTVLNTSTPESQTSVNVPSTSTGERRSIKALILTPTRELAIQVKEHLSNCLDIVLTAQRDQWLKHNEKNAASSSKHIPNPPPPVSITAIVGGMSAQSQRRILDRGVDILVVTPGRFWDLCQEDPWLAPQLRSLRFLVLDEADRMIETGHFQELDNILRLTAREADTSVDADNPLVPEDTELPSTESANKTPNNELQTFIFSATMSKDLQRDLKKRKKRTKKKEPASTFDELLMKLDFRDPNPVVIDLSPKGGKIEGLQESIVECLSSHKDAYLYYFLLRHPGKSLVFLGSIDGIRRLLPLLELLKIPVWPLHSGLQQKQRLKNFDRFKSTPNAVLLATDVAARGLDVPAVDHVIHYQVPRSADTYVHRNGRTARAMQQGFGLVLCAPDERRVFRGVLSGLERDESDVPELTVDHDILNKLKSRIQLAKQIDDMMHKVKKENHEKNWMKEMADAMEVELGSEFESDGSETGGKSSKKRKSEGKLAALKTELNHALSQPLVARGVSLRYITSGTRAIAGDLVAGNNHETLLGLSKLKAGAEVVKTRKTKK